MKKKVIITSSLAVLAAVGATAFLISPASAASNSTGSLISRVAQILNLDETKITDAFKQAKIEKLNQEVKDGNLTQEEADRIIQDIKDGKDFPMGGKRKMGMIVVGKDLADYLGVEGAELRDAIKDGKTPLEFAKEKGKTEEEVKNFLMTKETERIDNLLKNGKITQERADEMKKNLSSHIDSMLAGKKPELKGRPMRRGFFENDTTK